MANTGARRWAAACVLVALAACDDSHEDARVVAARAFLEQYHALACANAARCPAVVAQALGEYTVDSPSACAAFARVADPYPLDDVARGVASLDADAAAACLAELAAGGCAQADLFNWYANPDSCLHAFSWTTAGPGERCDDRPCGDGLYCAHGCPSVCARETPIGTPCATRTDCAGGETCTRDLRCARPWVTGAHAGDACGYSGGVLTVCGGDGSSCVAGTCVAPVTEGAPCTTPDECPSPDVCAGGACTRVPVAATGGAPCTAYPDEATTATPVCNELFGLYCGDDRACHVATGGADEPCDALLHCVAPLVCGRLARCAPPAADGAECESDAECSSGLCLALRCTACAAP